MRRRVLFGVSGRRRRTASPFVGGHSRPRGRSGRSAPAVWTVWTFSGFRASGDALRRPARLPLGVVLGAHGAREVGHHAQIQPRPELGERPRRRYARHGVDGRRRRGRREPEPSQRPAWAAPGSATGSAAPLSPSSLNVSAVSSFPSSRKNDAATPSTPVTPQRPTPGVARVHQVVQLVEQRGDEPAGRRTRARSLDLAAVGRRVERRVHVRLLHARAAASQSAASSSASAASAGAAAPNGTSSPPYGWYRAYRLMNAVANRSAGSASPRRRRRTTPPESPRRRKTRFPRRARREHERDAHRRVRERGARGHQNARSVSRRSVSRKRTRPALRTARQWLTAAAREKQPG